MGPLLHHPRTHFQFLFLLTRTCYEIWLILPFRTTTDTKATTAAPAKCKATIHHLCLPTIWKPTIFLNILPWNEYWTLNDMLRWLLTLQCIKPHKTWEKVNNTVTHSLTNYFRQYTIAWSNLCNLNQIMWSHVTYYLVGTHSSMIGAHLNLILIILCWSASKECY